MLFDFLRRAARNAVLAGVNDAVTEIAEALNLGDRDPEGEREAPEVEDRVRLLVNRPK